MKEKIERARAQGRDPAVDPAELSALQAKIAQQVQRKYGVTDEQVMAAVEHYNARNDPAFKEVLEQIARTLMMQLRELLRAAAAAAIKACAASKAICRSALRAPRSAQSTAVRAERSCRRAQSRAQAARRVRKLAATTHEIDASAVLDPSSAPARPAVRRRGLCSQASTFVCGCRTAPSARAPCRSTAAATPPARSSSTADEAEDVRELGRAASKRVGDRARERRRSHLRAQGEV